LKRPNRGWRCLMTLLWSFGCVAEAAVAAANPQDVVRETADRMLAVLDQRRPELERDSTIIFGLVEQIVLPKFDFERISQTVLARYWRRASAAQRSDFIKEFRDLLVRTYSRALLSYSGQPITYLPVRYSADGQQATVATQVSQAAGGPALTIGYRLRQEGDRWRVIDVVIDGVSLVSSYRNSFSTQINREGLDRLIQTLQEHNRPLARNEGGS